MRQNLSVSSTEYHLELPTYQEDPAFYDYSRMKYIHHIMECCDPIVLGSARKPTLDEQEGSFDS
jgi:hypothetical protein